MTSFDDRHAMLQAACYAPLRRFTAAIRARRGDTPEIDPLDGGTSARLLLLLETPGPAIVGPGMVSADNQTPTARNLRRFWAEAGLHRSNRLIWNAVPWIIHAGGRNRAPTRAEIRAGLAELPPLLALAPFEVAVLAGRTAAQAAPLLPACIKVLTMPHPSPTIVCTSPEIPRRIAAALAEAAAHLAQSPTSSTVGSTPSSTIS